jgi:hypothetical protein
MIDNILSRLDGVRKNGSGWMARCCAHEDRNPSLSITEKEGRILLKCFAGCDTASILDALGLTWQDLFADDLTEDKRNEYRQRYTEEEKRMARTILAIAEADRRRGVKLSRKDLETERRAWLTVNS